MSARSAGGHAAATTPQTDGGAAITDQPSSPAPARGTAGGTRPAGFPARGADPMARYLDLLGLKPGATLDAVNIAYFTVVKRFPENPTEEDEARMQELKRAYDIIRRAYVPPKARSVLVLFDKRRLMPLLGVTAFVLVGVLVYLNWGTIRLKMTHYEPGAVLRLKSATVPFGTIVGYEPAHQFPIGAPGAAYEVRLDGKTDTVWVAERLIVNGMVPVTK
jgi:hypothetical protein